MAIESALPTSDEERPIGRDWNTPLFWQLCAAPSAWLVLFYGYVLRARLSLGDWPRPYEPDPKDLGFGLHALLIWLGFTAVPAAVVGAVLLFAWRRRFGHAHRRDLDGVVVAVVTFGLWFAIVRTDPGMFFYWFVD